LCEKGSRFQWNDECEQAFIRSKDALISPLILSYPRPGCQFIVDSTFRISMGHSLTFFVNISDFNGTFSDGM
jgi:hypothetical protein